MRSTATILVTLLLLLGPGCSVQGQATSDGEAGSANAETRFESARSALKAGDVEGAAVHYREAASAGHAAAQFSLGVLYALGVGVAPDVEQALVWYGKAAAASGGKAQYVLAQRLEQGVPGRTDGARSRSWIERLSRLGDPTNPLRLGSDYTFGTAGLPPDPERAATWYLQAARQPHVMAWHRLGQMRAGGLGVKADHIRAHMWFSLCAELGLGDSAIWKQKLEQILTQEQLAQSAELVRQWKETTPMPEPLPPTRSVRPVH